MSCCNILPSLVTPKCDITNGVKYVLSVKKSDVKSMEDGKLVLKRKYGKFKREVTKYKL